MAALKKIEASVRRWFGLGLDEGEFSQYSSVSEYDIELAKDNLEAMEGYCYSSYLLLAVACLKGLHGDWVGANLLIFFLAFSVITGIVVTLRRGVAKTDVLRYSYLLTFLFNMTWCTVIIFYDIIMQPSQPGVMICVAVLLLNSIYNAYPKDNIVVSIVIYAIIMGIELLFGDPDIILIDSVNILVCMVLGIFVGQKRTRANISRKLYTDMYKAATKTSILVAQIDLAHDTYEILQSPESVYERLQKETSAMYGIQKVAEEFVAEEFQPLFLNLFHGNNIAEELEKTPVINSYFFNIKNRWCQLVIVEQRRRNGKISAVVVTVRDVDEERQREFEYQRRLQEAVKEAEMASAAKTNFLRRMSHDIRTPINGIRGMLEMAEYYSDDIEKQKECREKMWTASGYLLSLVNDVLDMNKLESGVVTLAHVSFDLQETLKEINTVTELQAMEHGIRFERKSSASDCPHRYLIGSQVHLKRVLQNILGNAVKYNRENGSVGISCTEQSFDGKTAVIQFVCEDTGMGMSEEFQKQAFEPFAQEGRKANTTYAGSGLGLSIVKELVTMMNGTVELTSEIDVGSVFKVTLPFEVDPEAEAREKQLEQVIDMTGRKVLLAEDNALNAEIAEFLLGNEGFEVTHAENGQEAVEKFAQSAPGEYEIIFMDIMMPVMNGLEATRAIRALDRPDAHRIPIIAMSANAFQDDINRSLEAGMNGHLMKPLEMEKVRKEIKRAIFETKSEWEIDSMK